jgi:lysophospholipase L1-like esterase
LTLARQGVLALQGEPATSPRDERPLLGPETDPILDYHDSLAAYHWDEEWRRGVVAHYEFNLRRMTSLARQAGVPVALVLPPSNLGGCPPFKSEHSRPLSPEERQRFDALVAAAREHYQTDIRRSIALLTEALEIDDRHAETLYDLGQCYRAIGQSAEARRWLVRARDCDVVPLRMISELEAALRRVADEEGVPFLDAHALLEAQTPQGILDDALLVDHIHPGFDGHQAIAAALLELLQGEGWVHPRPDWRPRTEAAWRRHFESLDYTYFARGQRFLKSLEGWTQGRGDGPPAAQRFPWRIHERGSALPPGESTKGD